MSVGDRSPPIPISAFFFSAFFSGPVSWSKDNPDFPSHANDVNCCLVSDGQSMAHPVLNHIFNMSHGGGPSVCGQVDTHSGRTSSSS